jgi:hypothetical protein
MKWKNSAGLHPEICPARCFSASRTCSRVAGSECHQVIRYCALLSPALARDVWARGLLTPSTPSSANRPLTEPAPSRLPPDHPHREEVLAAKAAALRAGEDGYLDPATGLFVSTAAYHATRGFCCENDCRHCPYVADD